jgi:hypothetical protein
MGFNADGFQSKPQEFAPEILRYRPRRRRRSYVRKDESESWIEAGALIRQISPLTIL